MADSELAVRGRKGTTGLADAVTAIPDHLHPTSVEGFMTTAQDDLDSRSPVSYLRTGGNPALVAEMVAELARP